MITKYTQYIKENVNNSQFFTTYEETKSWLDEMEIKNYTINTDLTVDVDGNVNLSFRTLTHIKVNFNKVKGFFNCSYSELTTLTGSPKEVKSDFVCSYNKLTTLDGSPKYVNGNFYCAFNNLISLDGLSIYNLKKSIEREWYMQLKRKIKEKYFDKNLKENSEIVSLIDFELSQKFKTKWEHLLNANKFDLI
jgi:hypothetical protein